MSPFCLYPLTGTSSSFSHIISSSTQSSLPPKFAPHSISPFDALGPKSPRESIHQCILLHSLPFINVEFIIGNYNKKITDALIRLFQTTITMNCTISKKDGGKLPSSGRGGSHVSEVIPPSTATLAYMFASFCLAK
jgi:hypothetical protein